MNTEYGIQYEQPRIANPEFGGIGNLESNGECRDESERGSMMQAVRSENVDEIMFLKHITVDEGFTDSMASAYSQSVSATKE